LREAAEAFESLVIETMLRTMRESQLEEGLFGESAGSSVYEGLFDAHVAGHVARGSPFGIARILEERLAPALETNRAEAAAAAPELKSPLPRPIGSAGGIPPEQGRAVPSQGDRDHAH